MSAEPASTYRDPDPLEIIEDRVKLKQSDCGIRARTFAFGIDALLLVLLGFLLGALFGPQLIEMGVWGRILGLAITVAYFGLFNSSLGKGQSIGKRITRIRVVGQNGKPVSLGTSLLRSLLLFTPYFLLDAPLFLSGSLLAPVITSFTLGAALGYVLGPVLVSFLGGVAYFFLSNSQNSQSLHDMALRTYVVLSKADWPVTVRPVEPVHYLVCSVLALLLLVVGTFLSFVIDGRQTASLLVLQKQLSEAVDVRSVSVLEGTAYTGDGAPYDYLDVGAYWKGMPPSGEEAANRLAQALADKYPPAWNKDEINVRVSYGYDIGIAGVYQHYELRLYEDFQPKKPGE